MKLIDKSALVAEIKRLLDKYSSIYTFNYGATQDLNHLLSFVDTLEVKEVDFDILGNLARHLIACDAHGITPKYSEEELDFLEELANNKAQKGE